MAQDDPWTNAIMAANNRSRAVSLAQEWSEIVCALESMHAEAGYTARWQSTTATHARSVAAELLHEARRINDLLWSLAS